MISKKRAQELIKNKATIYWLEWAAYDTNKLWKPRLYDITEIPLNNAEIVEHFNEYYFRWNDFFSYNTCSFNCLNFKNCYETKEEVEKEIELDIKRAKRIKESILEILKDENIILRD